MTQDKDLKRRVRERMRVTGESYTQALQHVRPPVAPHHKEQPLSGTTPERFTFAKFDDASKRLIVGSMEEARRHDHLHIGTEHMLAAFFSAALVPVEEAVAPAAAELQQVSRHALALVPAAGRSEDHLPFTPVLKRALERAFELASDDEAVEPRHLLWGLLWVAEAPVEDRILLEYGPAMIRTAMVELGYDPGELGARIA